MPKIEVLRDTWLKARPLSSTELQDNEKVFYETGKTFYATKVTPIGGQHLQLQLASPVSAADKTTKFSVGYVYAPHIKAEGEDALEIRLPIKWDSQINSRYPDQAYRMCFSCSVWMAASHASKKFADRFKKDDDYLNYMLGFGDTTQAPAHLAALKSLGVKAQYSETGSLKDLVKSIEDGLACCIGILHHGSVKYPSGGGHWLCIGGVSSKRDRFLAFDPFGSCCEAVPYSGAVENGNGYWIPGWVLDGRWTVYTPDRDGWMMTFYGN